MTKTAKQADNKLTEEQQEALKKLKSFLRSDRHFFRLSGYAGTGKSFLICHLIEWLDDCGFEFAIAAPTNKAAKSLMQVGSSVGINIDVKTVAQLLGQQPELNEETGEEEFTSSGNAEFDDYDVMIVDEFSMINRSNFEEIVQAITSTIDTKVIFVGDEAQLPPVKEKQPMVAISEAIEDTAVLDQVVRYEGEIAVVAEQIRSQEQFTRRMYPFQTSEDRTIVCQPRQEWLETVTEYFQADERQTNPDFARLLVHQQS
ncbi:MAG: AAA family ATPase, partial [Cyanobacteria bacterium J06631_6]